MNDPVDSTSDILRDGVQPLPSRSKEKMREELEENRRLLEVKRRSSRDGLRLPQEARVSDRDERGWEEDEEDPETLVLGESYEDPEDSEDLEDTEDSEDAEDAETVVLGEDYDDPETVVLPDQSDPETEVLYGTPEDTMEATKVDMADTKLYTGDQLRGYANISQFVRDQGISPTFPSVESLGDGINSAPSWWPGGGAVKRKWFYVDDTVDRSDRSILIARKGYGTLASALWNDQGKKGYRLDPTWVFGLVIITSIMTFACTLILTGFGSPALFLAIPATIILNLSVMRFLGSRVRVIDMGVEVRYFKVLSCVQEQAEDMAEKIRRRQVILAALQKFGDGDSWMATLAIRSIANMKSEHKKLMDWSTS